MVKHYRYLGINPIKVDLADGSIGVVIFKRDFGMLIADDKYQGTILKKKCGCCGSERPAFRLATQEEITEWQNL